jgi:hypothetical protein
MVGTYEKKSPSARWSEETMSKAIMSVIFGNVEFRRAADRFKVPHTMLQNLIANIRLRHALGTCEAII